MKWQFLSKAILLSLLISLGGQNVFATNKEHTFIGEQLLEMSPSYVKKGQMILSNSPEVVHDNGILYHEEVHGEGRLLFHHLNGTSTSKRFIAMIHNVQPAPMKLKLKKCEAVGPTKNILFAGKKLLDNYFQNQWSEETLIIPPLSEAILYDSIGHPWKSQEVLTGIVDYELDGRGELFTACMEASDPVERIKTLSYLPKDHHPRGTFYVLEETYTVHLPSFGAYYMCLEQEEDWAIGKDGITQEITMNKGNYGIMYHVTIQAEADTQIYIVPRAGVFKGVIKWEDGTLCAIERTHYFKHCKEPVLLGTVKEHTARTLSYMLPNGSAAPVWLQFHTIENNE